MEKLLHDLVLSPAWYFTAARGVTLILIVMTIAGYSVLLERKASAWIQGRIGPNRTMHPLIGWIPFLGNFLQKGGFIQPAADGGKFLFKEDALPGRCPVQVEQHRPTSPDRGHDLNDGRHQ